MLDSELARFYFETAENPALEEFLDFAYEKIFTAYVFKTLKETQKQFALQQKKWKMYRDELTDEDGREQVFACDQYELYFDELIKNLSKKQQELLILHFKLGYRCGEAAKMMGISNQSANGLKNRAFAMLRKELSIGGA